MEINWNFKVLVAGIALIIISMFFGSYGFFNQSEPLFLIMSLLSWIGWICIIAWVVLVAINFTKRRSTLLKIIKFLHFSRHDIIKSTNWARIGAGIYRKPLAIAFMIIGLFFIFTIFIAQFFIILFFIGIIVLAAGIYLWIKKIISIEFDFSKNVMIRLPTFFSIHTFHIFMRQGLEDQGYIISEDISPVEGGSTSIIPGIFLLKGGVKGIKKEIKLLRKDGKRAEIYLIEEGTIFHSNLNIYDQSIFDKLKSGHINLEPTIKSNQTSCELLLTIGATRNKFFEKDKLQQDFDNITALIENCINNTKSKIPYIDKDIDKIFHPKKLNREIIKQK